MEEKGFIAITISGKIGDEPLTPGDIDISGIKEMIGDVETFLYPTRNEKNDRPHISYKIEEGSAKHLFYLPISGVLLFNGLTSEIANRGSAGFLDYKRAEVISKFQRLAKEKDFEIKFDSSVKVDTPLIINKDTPILARV